MALIPLLVQLVLAFVIALLTPSGVLTERASIGTLLGRKRVSDQAAAEQQRKADIVFSALMFGLFHMNLYQFFYAFLLGLVFGYVYLRTRRLRYTVFMHMSINAIGGVTITALFRESICRRAVCGFLAWKKSTVILSKLRWTYGGPEGIRTHDLTDANRTLSQLSYRPK